LEPGTKTNLKISVALAGTGAMATAISNWRLLEADIVDCLQQHNLKITRDNFGNPHCAAINIHELAVELSECGVDEILSVGPTLLVRPQTAQGRREAERGYAARYLVSKSMADDGRSNKGQREERG
jgi:hypothetical protein